MQECFYSAVLECGILPKREVITFFCDISKFSLKEIQWIIENQPVLISDWALLGNNVAFFNLNNNSSIEVGKSRAIGYYNKSVFIDSLLDLEDENLLYILNRMIEDDGQFKALIPTYPLDRYYEYFNKLANEAVGRILN